MYTLSQLFESLAQRGLNVVRTGTSTLEITGRLQDATPELLESLKHHRDVFLSTLSIRKSEAERIAEAQSEYVDWLNQAMPPGYRLNEHLDFWEKHDRRLNVLIEIGDADFLQDYLETIRRNVVWHFLPHHPKPELGKSIIFFPGHALVDYSYV